MGNIILSIIVPVYNVEKYIDKCMDSIIENYHQGIEIILVNDGSKDNSASICDKYAKDYEYIKVVHKENGGLSSARNAGIKNAQGKYIWFVDSDDYIKEGSINKIIQASIKDPDLIISSHCNVHPDGSIVDDYLEKPSENENTAYEYFYNIGSASYAAVRFIVKKQLIIENQLYFTEGIYHEDEEWTPRVLLSAETFEIIRDSIYCYRVGNPLSIMGMTNPKKVKDKLYIVKKMYEKIDRDNIQGKKKEFLQYRIEHNFTVALNEIALYSGENKKELIDAIKSNLYLIENIKSRRMNIVKKAIAILGINLTSQLLRLRNKVK